MAYRRLVGFGVAAAAVLVLAVVGLWPVSPSSPKGGSFVGPTAAYAQEALDALRTVSSIACRTRHAFLQADDTLMMLDEWDNYYRANNLQRIDHYENNILVWRRWYTDDGKKITVTEVRPAERTYRVYQTGRGVSMSDCDPVESFRNEMKQIDKALRMLDSRWINGRECIGFEYDGNCTEDGKKIHHVVRTWLDPQTKLPVLIQTESACRGKTRLQFGNDDQFDFSPQPEDVFIPHIPEGYTKVN